LKFCTQINFTAIVSLQKNILKSIIVENSFSHSL